MTVAARSGALAHIRELFRSPAAIGSVCPSSRRLAERMASALSPELISSGTVLELGAGTGPVTAALLRRGVAPAGLCSVEISETLAAGLAAKFPGVRVLCRSADDLEGQLGDAPIVAAVSSLPFRSLPPELCRSIMAELDRVLAPGGLYIQFTYALIGDLPFVHAHYKKIRSSFVLANIPPARVDVYQKPGAHS